MLTFGIQHLKGQCRVINVSTLRLEWFTPFCNTYSEGTGMGLQNIYSIAAMFTFFLSTECTYICKSNI